MNFHPFARLPALMQRAHIHMDELSIGAGWIGALALTAWLAAGWFWRLTVPEPVILVTQQLTDPLAAARSVTQRHLFGNAETAPGSTAELAVRNFTLLGTMTANSRQPGFAVLAETGKPTISVFEGEELAPGIRLEKVMPDKVSIIYNDRSETLELVSGQSPHTPPFPAASSGAPRSMPPSQPTP
jgi:type II secretory pathway component PulC